MIDDPTSLWGPRESAGTWGCRMTPEGRSQERPSDHVIEDLQTRFIYPFFFPGLPEATSAFLSAERAGSDGRTEPVWRREDPHDLYTDEVLDHVTRFLFSSDQETAKKRSVGDGKAEEDKPLPGKAPGCTYLKMVDVVANRWLRDTRLWDERLPLDRRLPATLVTGVRIELFLSPQGVGVLSLALTPGAGRWTPDEAKRFNYQIAQCRRRKVVKLRRRHPKDDPEWEARIPPNQRGTIPREPSEKAPLAERLESPGGAFSIQELVEEILRPLHDKGIRLTAIQDELAVYTVARLGPQTDLDGEDGRDRVAPLLAALAQVEEPGHAGPAAGSVGVANVVLNRRHWAAVGQLGAAHLVIDQPSEGEGTGPAFNEQRLPLVRDKYFIPYLMALLQRLTLHRAIHSASLLGEVSDERAADELAGLRAGLLDFALHGHFTQVSVREALHRFYQTARTGLDVPNAWEEVRRAIADRDAQNAAARQERLAEGQKRIGQAMGSNLSHIARVQRFVHVLEYAICSVYFAHLWHMFTADNQALKGWLDERLSPGAGDWVVSGGVILFAAIGLGVAVLLDRLLRRGGHRDESP